MHYEHFIKNYYYYYIYAFIFIYAKLFCDPNCCKFKCTQLKSVNIGN